MFGLSRDRFRLWARDEIAREARANMLTYQAARHSLDSYEMRLDAIEMRLGKRVLALENRVMELEADQALGAPMPALRVERLHG